MKLNLRHTISLLVALSILAFNVASTTVFVQRGLERSKAHTLYGQKINARTNASVNRSIDKGSPVQHLNITFNLAAICSFLGMRFFIDAPTQVTSARIVRPAQDEPIYSSFKPPKLQLN
jgi:hypothetical protein